MFLIASIIVNKRKAFLVFFALALAFSLYKMNAVEVDNDLTDYLPETTETRIGLDIMNDQFATFGSGRIMVCNIDYDSALELAKRMEEVKGISSVSFYDPDDEDYEPEDKPDSYHDFNALYTISFEEEEDTQLSQDAIAALREMVSGYDHFVYTTVDKDDAKELQADIVQIMVFVVAIIIGVLIFTSTTYMEIIIFMVTFVVAIILNIGTNFIFGTISFISNAVGAILQIALAIDYAIILFHRYMEEKEKMESKQALIVALSKAIPEISSSSLTTMAGMVALMTMQFGIGFDLGRVLLKSIFFSMLGVFAFMPAVIMMLDKWIDRTRHRSFVPEIRFLGHIVVWLRHVIVVVFLFLIIGGIYFSNRCPYIYDMNSIEAEKLNEFLTSKREIEKYFDLTNTMAIVIPKGDYQSEGRLLTELEELPGVKQTLGLAGVEVGDDGEYVLTDSLTPRELAEVADVDIDVARLLYRFYAWQNEKYGAFLSSVDSFKVPIIDMIDFIYDQKENGGLELSTETSEDIEDLHKAITDARKQLEGEHYARLVFMWDLPLEGEETFAAIDNVREIAHKYYDEVYVVGDSTSDYDLSNSFLRDNLIISVVSAFLVGVILLFTFQNAMLPFILVFTIQGSIWINFSIPTLRDKPMFFLCYLIVSSIQMGATIDYAIVLTSRYLALREGAYESGEKDRKLLMGVIVQSLNEAFPTVLTSGTIMAAAGYVIGRTTSNGAIAYLGSTLFLGVVISIIMVMTVLPALLYTFDFFIELSGFDVGADERIKAIEERRRKRREKRLLKGGKQNKEQGEKDEKTEALQEKVLPGKGKEEKP
ncbi:MAG: MMPL family transporter [Lachnospiraceae bacterium]|nr:MMPL family transporter [Lachnospiraceae bacterium]